MLHFLMSTYNGGRDFWVLPNGGGEAKDKFLTATAQANKTQQIKKKPVTKKFSKEWK